MNNKNLEKTITLAHGAGGLKMQSLINNVIMSHFSNSVIDKMEDAAVMPGIKGRLVMTTDSFVVSPIFFSGGDIGRLSVCGTINDLSAMGARPLYLTAAFIIEEGLLVSTLEKIVFSMKKTCDEAGVFIACGDTKVVERGKADKIFINTSGIGEITGNKTRISCSAARPGDAIILSGALGEHEISILKERTGLGFDSSIKSDCAPLYDMLKPVIRLGAGIHVMRDPTRGGLAAVLNEIASASGVDISIDEAKVPENKTVKSACAIFGFDPFYLANEGKMVIICSDKSKYRVVKALKMSLYGKNASIIGKVTAKSKRNRVTALTASGGERVIFMAEGEQLPRIC
jgi:hydrogenase expression/formation protein HypE